MARVAGKGVGVGLRARVHDSGAARFGLGAVGWLVALVGPVAVSVLKLEIPALGSNRYSLLLLPVAVAAALGGLSRGLIATAVAATCVVLSIEIPGYSGSHDLGAMGVFVAASALTSGLVGALHRAHRRLEQALAEAREQEQRLRENEQRLEEQMDAIERSRAALSSEQNGRHRAEEQLESAEAQLRQAHKMEAVGRLAAGIAHDFNNLLSVILGHTSAVLTIKDPGELRQDIEQIQAAAERAAALTRQLLAFGRKQILEPRVVDVNEVVEEAGKLIGRLLGEDIAIVVGPASAGARSKCDPGQLEQVLVNLAVNARDAMPDGGKLEIRIREVELTAAEGPTLGARAGRYVEISVSDDGVGMDSETLARMFEPFFTTKQPGVGTGLGLSTAFGIVKQSGGSIAAESEPGRGTTVKVLLPWTDEPAAARVVPAAPRSLRGSEAILLVEDDEQVQAVMQQLLERHGYNVVTARDGEHALDVFSIHRESVQLLLTDVVMPRLGGRELARRLSVEKPSLRVLYTSGYADPIPLELDRPLLRKPLTADTLLAKVREVLDAPAQPPFPLS